MSFFLLNIWYIIFLALGIVCGYVTVQGLSS